MDKMRMHTPDITEDNIEKIGHLFPNCLTEHIGEGGKVEKVIDFDMLRQELSKEIVEGPQERYQFTWPDKKKAIRLANAPTTMTLRPCREESVDYDNTGNLYIEGDNLEVLKILRETYLGKVKLVYIDPPYNTGNDFVYEDDFSQTVAGYIGNSGQMDASGNKLVQNTESNGRFHTDWLNMMYPRLKVAKDLLSDDGAIFVSIDYNEVENLKKILDEIFGSDNFQREIIWRIGWLSGYKTMAPNFIRNHDTILFYSKRPDKFFFNKKYIENKEFKPILKKDANVTAKLAKLGLSDAQQKDLLHFINYENRPERYPIEDTWNCNEYDDLNSIAIVSFSGEKISKILEIDQDFKGQKSVKMLQRIIEATTEENDLILDFFSGTASTAHAVMNYNATYGGNRKFIMVQLPEETDEDSVAFRNGYKNICEIGKERIRRVAKKLREDSSNPLTVDEGLFAATIDSGVAMDFGFRVLKLDSSNMEDVYYKPEDSSKSTLFEDNVKPDRSGEDLLFQVMLECNLPLSAKIQTEKIAGKDVFSVNNGYLIACFDEDVNEEVITAVAKRKPYYFIMRDKSLSSDNVADNFEQIFQAYSKETIRRIL